MDTGLKIGKVILVNTEDELRNLVHKYDTHRTLDIDAFCLEDVSGYTCCIPNEKEGLVHVVYLNTKHGLGREYKHDYMMTVIHEAVHVKQGYLKYICEENPGDEIEAYLVEGIVDSLVQQFAEKEEKWKKQSKRKIV